MTITEYGKLIKEENEDFIVLIKYVSFIDVLIMMLLLFITY